MDPFTIEFNQTSTSGKMGFVFGSRRSAEERRKEKEGGSSSGLAMERRTEREGDEGADDEECVV